MFATSLSVPVAGSTSIAIPYTVDVGGSGFSGPRHAHVQVVGTLAAGTLTVTFNTPTSPTYIISGIGDMVIPIPSMANQVVIVASGGGVGVVNFGKDM